jgi:hypothetical protein
MKVICFAILLLCGLIMATESEPSPGVFDVLNDIMENIHGDGLAKQESVQDTEVHSKAVDSEALLLPKDPNLSNALAEHGEIVSAPPALELKNEPVSAHQPLPPLPAGPSQSPQPQPLDEPKPTPPSSDATNPSSSPIPQPSPANPPATESTSPNPNAPDKAPVEAVDMPALPLRITPGRRCLPRNPSRNSLLVCRS